MKSLIFVVAAVLSLNSFGRWATLEDAEAITEFTKAELRIKADGTYELIGEEQIEIKNEEGRSKYANFRIPYTTETSELEILEAKTINGKQEFKVPKSLIEDKTFASSVNGFDQINQVTIAYPGVEVGSRLYRKLRMKVKKVRFPNFFSFREVLGTETYTVNSEYTLRSELPLLVEKNDPTGVLAVEQETSGKESVLKIRLKAPIFTRVMDEKEAYLRPNQETWFVVSSSKSFAELGNSVAVEYEKLLNDELPPSFAKILEAARQEKNAVDQINRVTSLLQNEVRYLGEWRTIRGSFIPRPLGEVADTRFGDCKDYSTITGNILRRLGYETQVAWVYRGITDIPLPKLALDSGFNHAIVWTKKDGKVRWIDPTNFSSFAQGIYEDIMDRAAIVVQPNQSHLDHIPLDTPEGEQFIRQYAIRMLPAGEIDMDASISLMGRAAISITGLSIRTSKEAINYLITQAIAGEKLVLESKVGAYDLTSRVVRDVKLTARMRVKNYLYRTTAGDAYPLGFEPLQSVMDLDIKNRVSSVKLSQPAIQTSRYSLKNSRVVGKRGLGCEVRSPWIDVKRKMTPNKKERSIDVEDRIVIKRGYIAAEDIHSLPYLEFQKRLQECLYQALIVYQPATR